MWTALCWGRFTAPTRGPVCGLPWAAAGLQPQTMAPCTWCSPSHSGTPGTRLGLGLEGAHLPHGVARGRGALRAQNGSYRHATLTLSSNVSQPPRDSSQQLLSPVPPTEKSRKIPQSPPALPTLLRLLHSLPKQNPQAAGARDKHWAVGLFL